MARTATLEAPAGLGHNQPPDPFGAISAHMEDLLTEARNWADGAAVATQAQADEVARLVDQLRDALGAADDARKAEQKPHADIVDAIQAKWNAYIAPTKNKTPGKVPVAMDVLKGVQTAWLRKLEDAQRAEAARLRAEAEQRTKEAAEALRASAGNLEAREQAEAALSDARGLDEAASRAESVKAHAHGEGRATHLRDNWTVSLADGQAALRHYWTVNRTALEAFALDLARADVRRGLRTIPGFTVVNERRV